MKDQLQESYPLDNSAMIHLAAMRKNYTNEFRIVVTLKEPVCAEALQKAVNHITLRFPTIIAGIRPGFFQYHVVPEKVPPRIKREQECLAPMTKEEIQKCAFRIFYGENRIVTEFFHSLTDGYGGMIVTNTLVAEYLKIKHSVSIPVTELTLDTESPALKEELSDDYVAYAGKKPAAPKHRNVYQLPGISAAAYRVTPTRRIYPAEVIAETAHYYGASVTVFLTAVMVSAVMDIQKQHITEKKDKRPIQIMVPVNLRRLFPSRTVRNFSLYAFAGAEPQDENIPFEELTGRVRKQLSQQITAPAMEAAMAMNTRAGRFPLYRAMPLPVKWLLLRLVHQFFGESNSCISISNLGIISVPERMQDFIEEMDFMLTPRIHSPYNCGIVTFDGKMAVNFTRSSREPELETLFFKKLEQFMETAGSPPR